MFSSGSLYTRNLPYRLNLPIKMHVRTVLYKFMLIRLGFNISLYFSKFESAFKSKMVAVYSATRVDCVAD